MIRHLTAHDCRVVREGGRHSWWGHSTSGKRKAVPRHTEITNTLVLKICKDLDIPSPFEG
ncbi:MAG: type II toxin-antitoxin system HicA family toxin [Verrucomicrobiae bacterium]|nr:type II toxin-antitoxin system HicA family toxin [Verrucomicrobiae bacterium]